MQFILVFIVVPLLLMPACLLLVPLQHFFAVCCESNSNLLFSLFPPGLIMEAVNELIYTPKGERDYGTLACWGRNSIGKQIEPCLFQIVPAGTYSDMLLFFFPNRRHPNILNSFSSRVKMKGTTLRQLARKLCWRAR